VGPAESIAIGFGGDAIVVVGHWAGPPNNCKFHDNHIANVSQHAFGGLMIGWFSSGRAIMPGARSMTTILDTKRAERV